MKKILLTLIILFFVILFILTILYLIKIKPVTFAIFTTGFAAASLEVIILIGFQILYGFAYHQISIIITAFMIGLAMIWKTGDTGIL